jgi:FAD-linked sulfhydryl oxidase
MPRRQHVTLLLLLGISAFLGLSFVLTLRGGPGSYNYLLPASQEPILVDNEILLGTATAPKLENATLKYVPPARAMRDPID